MSFKSSFLLHTPISLWKMLEVLRRPKGNTFLIKKYIYQMSNKYRQRDSHFGSYQCICVCAGEDTDFFSDYSCVCHSNLPSSSSISLWKMLEVLRRPKGNTFLIKKYIYQMSNKYRQRDSHFGSYQCICVCAGEDTDFNAMPYLKVYRLFSLCCTTTKRGLSILFSVEVNIP